MMSAQPPKPARFSLNPTALPQRLDWIFALRTAASGLAALYLALLLKLDEPQWAIMTVFIVSQPFTGMVLAKGFYRVLGTMAGALVAFILIWTLGGFPLAFLLAMALWLGTCTFVSGLLRDAEAYGAVLAGYSAGIIGFPALTQPHIASELALARCTEILLGIVCAGLASAFILPRPVRPVIRKRLREMLAKLAGHAAAALRGDAVEGLRATQRALIAESQALHTLRSYAVMEAPSLGSRHRLVMHIIGDMLSAMSAARTLRLHAGPREAREEADGPHALLDRTAALLDEFAKGTTRLVDMSARLGEVARRILERRAGLHAGPAAEAEHDLVGAAILSRLSDLIEALTRAFNGFEALVSLKDAPERGPNTRLQVHRDQPRSFRNAVRAAAALLVVSLIWWASGDKEAVGAVVLVAVITGLFAHQPNPVTASREFLLGTLLGVPCAFLVGQLILPGLPGLGWLAIVLTPFLVAAGLAMARPRFVRIATPFAINFLALLAPQAVMTRSTELFLWHAFAMVLGLAIAIGVFWTVLPPKRHREVAQTIQAMRADVARLCLRGVPARLVFESRMYDRINHLLQRLDASVRKPDRLVEGSLALVTLGLEVVSLRSRGDAAAPDHSLGALLARLAGALASPPGTAELQALIARARELALARFELPEARGLEDAVALRLIAAALADNMAFFAGEEAPELPAN